MSITFDPSVTQVNLTSYLPYLMDAGTWIDGSAGVPRIDASGVDPGGVFVIDGNDITISNLSIVNGNSGNPDIAVLGLVGSKNARIAYNYLGTLPGATNCTPSGVTRNSLWGVYVAPNSRGSSGANNGVAYIYGNIIGCHGQHGIYVSGADLLYIGVQPDGVTSDGNNIGISTTGFGLPNGGDGVYFWANGTDGVRNGVIRSNQIWSNAGNGIHLQGTGSNSAGSTTLNWIQANYISSNGQSGIRLTAGAYTNFIGGGGAADPNTIDWNGWDGISILESNNNLIQRNRIGVIAGGRGNFQAGIYLQDAHANTIVSNEISANAWAGVWANNSNYNTIKGNIIGTNDAGTAALANGNDGVALTNNAHDNTIGGTTSADRNIISGNSHCGIRLRDGAYNNTIDYNLIGLDALGTGAIPNGLAGVCLFSGSNNNSIGTSLAGVSQYISGNTREGIYIENSSGTFVGQTNRIGVATDDTTARGNGLQGAMLNGATNSIIQPGLVAYNGGAGIAVISNAATGNDVGPTEVRNNGGLPIDLGNDGHTPNGSRTPPGPNNWLNYPVITGGSGNTINGTACANCTVFIYRAIGNPAAPGGGGRYLQSTTANGSGNWSATLPAGMGRNDVTAQARDSAFNTSEMSPRPILYLPLILR
ncbi:MAG: right-handed parallel beta-helix repeat-containing protein [Chloroflexi bacterium]|nr:right-handed parallel beta-helix repeat-containing protein [Chloroflexota bacterium]